MNTHPNGQDEGVEFDVDTQEIMDSGERLPSEMWELGLSDVMLANPVFNGEEVVEGEGN